MISGERLSLIVRDRVEQEVRRRIIRPYTERNLEFHKDNWSAVCAGSVGVATMYWGYGFGYCTYYAEMLRTFSGEHFKEYFFRDCKCEKMAEAVKKILG